MTAECLGDVSRRRTQQTRARFRDPRIESVSAPVAQGECGLEGACDGYDWPKLSRAATGLYQHLHRMEQVKNQSDDEGSCQSGAETEEAGKGQEAKCAFPCRGDALAVLVEREARFTFACATDKVCI